MQVTIRSPIPERPLKVQGWPPKATPRRVISAKPRVIKERKTSTDEAEIGKSAEAEGNTEPALPEEPKQSEPTEPKKIYEDDRDDPDYVPFD